MITHPMGADGGGAHEAGAGVMADAALHRCCGVAERGLSAEHLFSPDTTNEDHVTDSGPNASDRQNVEQS